MDEPRQANCARCRPLPTGRAGPPHPAARASAGPAAEQLVRSCLRPLIYARGCSVLRAELLAFVDQVSASGRERPRAAAVSVASGRTCSCPEICFVRQWLAVPACRRGRSRSRAAAADAVPMPHSRTSRAPPAEQATAHQRQEARCLQLKCVHALDMDGNASICGADADAKAIRA